MRLSVFFTGALLVAAPLCCQPAIADPQLRNGAVQWCTLFETKEAAAKALGRPISVADFGNDFQSWQYQIGNSDHHEFSHLLVFRKSDNSLVSVTRNYEAAQTVDALFPISETSTYTYPSTGVPIYSLRLRRLPGGRVLMAMGASKPGQRTDQLVLMRESELRYFYPWLFEQLKR